MARDLDLHTSGEVTGLTKVPAVTVQRYVKTFPEFFSDRAKIHTKGRRYTTKDVELILVIRAFADRGISFKGIKKLIDEGKFDPSAISKQEQVDAIRINARSRDDLDRMELLMVSIGGDIEDCKYQVREAAKLTDEIDKRNKIALAQIGSKQMNPETDYQEIAGYLFPFILGIALVSIYSQWAWWIVYVIVILMVVAGVASKFNPADLE
jgi:DNA-binding transcriptional MerR regulator